MSNLTEHQAKVLQKLKDAGLTGLNSYSDFRKDNALQISGTIRELREKGYHIESVRKNGDRSATYILMHPTPLPTKESKEAAEPTTAPQSRALVYDSVEGTAREMTLEQIEAMLADLRMQYAKAPAQHRFDIRKRADNYVEGKRELLKRQPIQTIQAP